MYLGDEVVMSLPYSTALAYLHWEKMERKTLDWITACIDEGVPYKESRDFLELISAGKVPFLLNGQQYFLPLQGVVATPIDIIRTAQERLHLDGMNSIFNGLVVEFCRLLIEARTTFDVDGFDFHREACTLQCARITIQLRVRLLQQNLDSASTEDEQLEVQTQLNETKLHLIRCLNAIAILKVIRHHLGHDPDSFLPNSMKQPSITFDDEDESLEPFENACVNFKAQEEFEVENRTGLMRCKSVGEVREHLAAYVDIVRAAVDKKDIERMLCHFRGDLIVEHRKAQSSD